MITNESNIGHYNGSHCLKNGNSKSFYNTNSNNQTLKDIKGNSFHNNKMHGEFFYNLFTGKKLYQSYFIFIPIEDKSHISYMLEKYYKVRSKVDRKSPIKSKTFYTNGVRNISMFLGRRWHYVLL